MRISTLLFSAAAVLALTSCISNMKVSEEKKESQYWIVPPPEEEAEAYIGDSLFKEGRSEASDAIILKEDHGVKGITTFHQKGTYKYIGNSVKKKYGNAMYSNSAEVLSEKTVKVYQSDFLMPGVSGAIYPQIYETEDGSVYLHNASGGELLDKKEYEKKTVIDVGDYYFEQQLIYTGSEGHILKFTYREFADGTARPAFSLDATYDLSRDRRIRFKGAILDILSYDNQSIRYRVISGFKS